MKLEAIVSAVCEAFGDIAVDEVWSDFIVLRGRRSFDHAEPGFLYETGKERVPLNGEMELNDHFLLFEEIGHYPLSCLIVVDSKAELERALLDGGGYLNPFTTRTACIIEGRVAPFEVYYCTPDGAEKRFDKGEQQSHTDPFALEYPNARLAWQGVGA